MSTTFIHTADCARSRVAGAGEVAEILNPKLCGAKNVLGMLRWLSGSDRLAPAPKAATHQLLYVMEGDGVITLDGKDYAVGRGAGVYLGPNETATIRPSGKGTVKLFHLVVPEVKDASTGRAA
jgi:mannose-6-phosphate isomerase-like protein (cupin superfamily)